MVVNKTFSIDDYVNKDSDFVIGIEFERTDDEIKEYFRSHEREAHPNIAPFEGKFALIHKAEFLYLDDEFNSYPLEDYDWLVREFDFYARELDSDNIEILSQKLENNEEIVSEDLIYRHVHNSLSYEKKPLIYSRRAKSMIINTVNPRREVIVPTQDFIATLQDYKQITNTVTEKFGPFWNNSLQQYI